MEKYGHGKKDRRIRVLISAFACEPGRGSEQEVGWKWACEMARYADVTVLTQTRNRPGIERWIRENGVEDLGFRIEYVQFPDPVYRLKSRFDALTFPYYAAWQFLALRTGRNLHKKRPFDLIHHVTFVTFRVPVWWKYLGVPVVFGPVGGVDIAPWRLLLHGMSPVSALREGVRNVATHIGRVVLRIFPPVKNDLGICLGATPKMTSLFLASGFEAKTMPAIGVEDAAFDADVSVPPGRLARRFLYVGRLHPLKGLHLAFEAFARAEIPGATLTVVGSGGEEKRLRKLSESLGISNAIEWIGKVRRPQLREYYQSHDVLLAPSLYESGGMTAIEAMSLGRPCIVLAVGGHALSVGDQCGFAVSTDGPAWQVIDRIADAMARCANEDGLVRAQGKVAREKVGEAYHWKNKGMAMYGIYKKTLRLAERKDERNPAC